MSSLPNTLYKVDSVVRLEQIAINQFNLSAYELMQRAGAAVFCVIKKRYPQLKKILIVCGAGNNAGDGYVVARLAKQAGHQVRVVSLIDPVSLKDAAQLAYQGWTKVAGENAVGLNAIDSNDLSSIDDAEIIIDAIFGTGLSREVSAHWARWIEAVNQSAKPVVAIDIPSGLLADTGAIAGAAIRADVTVSFIALKQGMFTAQGNDVCGEIVFDDLSLPEECYVQVPCDVLLIDEINCSLLKKRKPSSHKGNFGHVLIVGGNTGMPGAVILAARAALRTGAGLVTIITVENNVAAISAAVPEAMLRACDVASADALFNAAFIVDVTHVAIGMGLGQDAWSEKILKHCVKLNKPLLIDADGLNLLPKLNLNIISPLVITPHPGEASRLLDAGTLNQKVKISSATIQQDRFAAIKKLHALFSGSESCTVILKGSGTLIFDGQTMKICKLGTPAMAAPGMGDVLSGIIIALMAQTQHDATIAVSDIVELGVCLHAGAAKQVVGDRTRGLLASDVVEKLSEILS